MEENKEWINERVFVMLENNRVYNGMVIKFEGRWITIIDKFDKLIMLNLSDIKILQEESVRGENDY